MSPNKIFTLWQLQMAVKSKKAVVVPKGYVWSKPRPAAFMINLPGAVLIRLFDLGMYIYKKPNKGERKCTQEQIMKYQKMMKRNY